jgi:hypothetical protein
MGGKWQRPGYRGDSDVSFKGSTPLPDSLLPSDLPEASESMFN